MGICMELEYVSKIEELRAVLILCYTDLVLLETIDKLS